MRLDYHTTTRVWLSLEDYYNAGLTPERAKEIIESLRDEDGYPLHCEPGGINRNWIVETHEDLVGYLVLRIRSALNSAMFRAGLSEDAPQRLGNP